MRTLATIQTIDNLQDIPDAQNIVVASVLGWKCVVKKDDFNIGDPCIYFEIDSLLPQTPEFEFLSKYGVKKSDIDGVIYEGYRLRSARIRKCLSQGLAMRIEDCPKLNDEYKSGFLTDLLGNPIWDLKNHIGLDISDIIGVVKYEPPIPVSQQGEIKGKFPAFIPKTDLIRIQSVPEVLMRHAGKKFMVQEKVDGQSITCYLDGDTFGVCSRNLELKLDNPTPDSRTQTVSNLQIHDKMLTFRKWYKDHFGGIDLDFALQGEYVGPGSQDNRLQLKYKTILFFDMFNIRTQRYFNPPDFITYAEIMDIPTVPVLEESMELTKDLEWFIEYADNDMSIAAMSGADIKMASKVQLEGHAWKSLEEDVDRELGRLVFKVINNSYLLKHGE